MTQTSYGTGRYVATEGDVIITSRFEKQNGTRRGTMWGHGANSSALLDGTTPYGREVTAAIAEQNGPVVATDLGGAGSTLLWGNDTAISRGGSTKTYLQGTAGAKSGTILLAGISMGGLTVLNWARANLASVAAIALLWPVVDLEDVRANNRGGYQASIESAYTNNAGWQAVRSTHNPTEYAASLASIPIAVWYATDDAVATPAAVTAFAAVHGNTTLNSMGTGGHVGETPPASAIATWLAKQP